MIPRGKYVCERVGDPPAGEAEHFLRCPACGGWIDCRDLGQVFEHEGPLPHPAQDQPQMTGAQFEIRIDGTPRSYRDDAAVMPDVRGQRRAAPASCTLEIKPRESQTLA